MREASPLRTCFLFNALSKIAGVHTMIYSQKEFEKKVFIILTLLISMVALIKYHKGEGSESFTNLFNALSKIAGVHTMIYSQREFEKKVGGGGGIHQILSE